MSTLTRAAGGVLNRLLHSAGYQLVRTWELEARATFTFNGLSFPYTAHHYNCGWPLGQTTERTVELSLADHWLNTVGADRVVEVGAVTPYYWPGRVRRVIDPADPHPQVIDRRSITALDLSQDLMLSISTFEHFGLAEYGLAADPDVLHRALNNLFTNSPGFLVTVPTGYNTALDRVIFEQRLPTDVNVGYLVRSVPVWQWRQETDPRLACRPYTTRSTRAVKAADGLAVLERGTILFPAGSKGREQNLPPRGGERVTSHLA